MQAYKLQECLQSREQESNQDAQMQATKMQQRKRGNYKTPDSMKE